MVKRVPDGDDCEIKWGAQLTVRESQVAVFFRDGRALDVFGPGRHVLQTANVPVISKWVTWFGYGPDSPFRAEVYFLSRLPAKVDSTEVVAVVVMSLALSFLATVYPSWRAASLDPVEALRYE